MTVLNPKVKKQDGEVNGVRWAERKAPRDPWRKSRRGNQHGCFAFGPSTDKNFRSYLIK